MRRRSPSPVGITSLSNRRRQFPSCVIALYTKKGRTPNPPIGDEKDAARFWNRAASSFCLQSFWLPVKRAEELVNVVQVHCPVAVGGAELAEDLVDLDAT